MLTNWDVKIHRRYGEVLSGLTLLGWVLQPCPSSAVPTLAASAAPPAHRAFPQSGCDTWSRGQLWRIFLLCVFFNVVRAGLMWQPVTCRQGQFRWLLLHWCWVALHCLACGCCRVLPRWTAVYFLFNSGCVHVWKPKCSCELSCLRMQMYLVLPHCWRDLLHFFSVPLVPACTEAQCIYIKIKSFALQLTCRCCSDDWMNEMHAWSLTKKIYVDSWNGFQPCPPLWICLYVKNSIDGFGGVSVWKLADVKSFSQEDFMQSCWQMKWLPE